MTTLVDYSSSDEGDESHSSTIADTEASQNSSKTIAASTYTGKRTPIFLSIPLFLAETPQVRNKGANKKLLHLLARHLWVLS